MNGVFVVVGVCIVFCEVYDVVFGGCVGCVVYGVVGGDDFIYICDVDDVVVVFVRVEIFGMKLVVRFFNKWGLELGCIFVLVLW